MMRKLSIAIAGIFLVGLLGGGGCPVGNGDNVMYRKLRVVATFTVPADLVAEVGGTNVSITTIVGPDGDAHTFNPTPQDVQAFTNADLILENGAGFEAAWLDKAYAASGSKAKRVVLSQGLKTLSLPGSHGHAAEVDPHVWHDVANAKHFVGNMTTAMSSIQPNMSSLYGTNKRVLIEKFDRLDVWVEEKVAELPKERRKLVTNHDTFGYFAARYDFTVVGTVLNSVSTEAAEPSAAEFAALVEAIKREKVPAIFCDASHNPKLVERIAAAAGVKVAAPLFTDGLGPKDGPGGTYEGMMKHNVTTIVEALKAPSP